MGAGTNGSRYQREQVGLCIRIGNGKDYRIHPHFRDTVKCLLQIYFDRGLP